MTLHSQVLSTISSIRNIDISYKESKKWPNICKKVLTTYVQSWFFKDKKNLSISKTKNALIKKYLVLYCIPNKLDTIP